MPPGPAAACPWHGQACSAWCEGWAGGGGEPARFLGFLFGFGHRAPLCCPGVTLKDVGLRVGAEGSSSVGFFLPVGRFWCLAHNGARGSFAASSLVPRCAWHTRLCRRLCPRSLGFHTYMAKRYPVPTRYPGLDPPPTSKTTTMTLKHVLYGTRKRRTEGHRLALPLQGLLN